MRSIRNATLVLLALTLSGCASATTGADGIRRDPNMIVAAELTQFPTMNLMDVVNQLRPRWLRTRGAPSLEFGGDDAVYVVVDGGAPQDWLILNTIQADEVVEIEYFDAREATFRWGTGFPNGIVEVRTTVR